LINDFGPPVASPSAGRQRAAMPFVHLERELWDLRDATGKEIAPDAPERRAWLLERGAIGRLQAPVERLLTDPGTLAAAARLLLDQICVSSLYVARNEAGRAVDALAGKPLLIPRPHQPTVDVVHISWHHQQVFKGHCAR